MKLLLPGAVTTNCYYIFLPSTCHRQLQRYNNQSIVLKVRLQNTWIYRIYNPQALSSTLASLRHYSPGPLGYKFCRSLCSESNYYITIVYILLGFFLEFPVNPYYKPLAWFMIHRIDKLDGPDMVEAIYNLYTIILVFVRLLPAIYKVEIRWKFCKYMQGISKQNLHVS